MAILINHECVAFKKTGYNILFYFSLSPKKDFLLECGWSYLLNCCPLAVAIAFLYAHFIFLRINWLPDTIFLKQLHFNNSVYKFFQRYLLHKEVIGLYSQLRNHNMTLCSKKPTQIMMAWCQVYKFCFCWYFVSFECDTCILFFLKCLLEHKLGVIR